jgi:hypothetical protein
MSLDVLYALTSDPMLMRAFNAIVDARRIDFGKIVAALDGDREKARESVTRLVNFGLISESGAILEDYKTYFVTSEGLGTNRELRRQLYAS